MKEKIVMFAIGVIFALVSLYILHDFGIGTPDVANAQRTYQVEVLYDVAGGTYIETEIENKLSEGYRIAGFASHYIPTDDPGVLVLMVK